MSLSTVIVVDDEKWSIVDLLNSVAWEARGFQIVAYFDRSTVALDRILADPPDVVFTDLRMPRMDGIELMRKARDAGLECEFVVISAFADFNSARKAIDVGVADYCLKPVNPEALSSLLEKLKKKLDKKARPAAGPETPTIAPLPENFGRIVAYIGENYREDLSLEAVAERFNLNKNYLCNLFKKNLDTTFSRYVAGLRIGLAKEYLVKSSESLEDIARKVGYEDYFYFCKVFKKLEAVSPGRFRTGLRAGARAPESP